MIYKIIRTGSKGNALGVEIGGYCLLIDCGVPYKDISGYRIDAVLLTHRHGDHFNRSTAARIAFDYPKCIFFTPEDLAGDMMSIMGIRSKTRLIKVYGGRDEIFAFGGEDLIFEPFSLTHDVPNVGWKIDSSTESMLYATDTADMAGLAFKNLDYYFLEANYDEEELEKSIREKNASGEYCYEKRVRETHLSRQQADRWLADNAGDNSKIIYMHEHSDAHGGEND